LATPQNRKLAGGGESSGGGLTHWPPLSIASRGPRRPLQHPIERPFAECRALVNHAVFRSHFGGHPQLEGIALRFKCRVSFCIRQKIEHILATKKTWVGRPKPLGCFGVLLVWDRDAPKKSCRISNSGVRRRPAVATTSQPTSFPDNGLVSFFSRRLSGILVVSCAMSGRNPSRFASSAGSMGFHSRVVLLQQ